MKTQIISIENGNYVPDVEHKYNPDIQEKSRLFATRTKQELLNIEAEFIFEKDVIKNLKEQMLDNEYAWHFYYSFCNSPYEWKKKGFDGIMEDLGFRGASWLVADTRALEESGNSIDVWGNDTRLYGTLYPEVEADLNKLGWYKQECEEFKNKTGYYKER